MTDPCPFCSLPAHTGACAALLDYVSEARDRMRERTILTYRCNSCNDPMAFDGLCAACEEWECKQLDLDFAPVGWA